MHGGVDTHVATATGNWTKNSYADSRTSASRDSQNLSTDVIPSKMCVLRQ